MLTAKLARELTDKAIQRDIENRQRRAEELCEDIYSTIEVIANKGLSSHTVQNIPTDIYHYIVCYIKEAGFEVNKLDKETISIKW